MAISQRVQFAIIQRLANACGGLDRVRDLMAGTSETLKLPVYSHRACSNLGVSNSEPCANPGSLSCSRVRCGLCLFYDKLSTYIGVLVPPRQILRKSLSDRSLAKTPSRLQRPATQGRLATRLDQREPNAGVYRRSTGGSRVIWMQSESQCAIRVG